MVLHKSLMWGLELNLSYYWLAQNYLPDQMAVEMLADPNQCSSLLSDKIRGPSSSIANIPDWSVVGVRGTKVKHQSSRRIFRA